MIIIRDSVRVLFEGIVISTFILEPIGDIQKCFKVRVTGRDYKKTPDVLSSSGRISFMASLTKSVTKSRRNL